MEAKVKRSARQARRAAKKKAEQPASAWQEAGSEPQSPSGNGRDPPSPNGGDEILDIEEIDGDQEIPSLEELTRLGQEHLLEEP